MHLFLLQATLSSSVSCYVYDNVGRSVKSRRRPLLQIFPPQKNLLGLYFQSHPAASKEKRKGTSRFLKICVYFSLQKRRNSRGSFRSSPQLQCKLFWEIIGTQKLLQHRALLRVWIGRSDNKFSVFGASQATVRPPNHEVISPPNHCFGMLHSR